MDELMKVARDCFYSPIYMKKNRPAYKLSVLCDKDKLEDVEDIIFSNTSSIGIRKIEVERSVLERKIINIDYEGLRLSYKRFFTRINPMYILNTSLQKTWQHKILYRSKKRSIK